VMRHVYKTCLSAFQAPFDSLERRFTTLFRLLQQPRSERNNEGKFASMNPLKKWLLLGLLLFLAWALPSKASFYISYHGPAPATVSIDGNVAFTVGTAS
jgi:hypothetical protein